VWEYDESFLEFFVEQITPAATTSARRKKETFLFDLGINAKWRVVSIPRRKDQSVFHCIRIASLITFLTPASPTATTVRVAATTLKPTDRPNKDYGVIIIIIPTFPLPLSLVILSQQQQSFF
jgi:hypothetical protein